MAGGLVANTGGNAQINELLHHGAWYKNGRLITLNAWIFLLLITSSTNGYDGSMMNGLQTLKQWNSAFNYPTGGMLGLLNCIQTVGALAATPIAPYLTDGLGRRIPILIGASIMIIGTIVQTLSHNVGTFIGARFCIGFGLTFAANAAPLLVTELAYPSQRAPLTSLYNSLWYSGAIVAAWTTYGTFRIQSSWAWRLPSVLQGLPSIAQVLLMWFCPESPRWLVGKGRDADALRTLAYYHARGNDQDPLVQFEYNEIKEAIALDRAANENVGWTTLFATPGNRKRMRIIIALAFFSQWSGNGLVSYYLNKVFDTIGITDVAIQNLINGILQLFNFFVAIIAGLLCDRVGRRTLFISSNIGMLIFFIMQTVCSARYAVTGSHAAANAVIAFIFLYYGSYDIAYTPLIVSYTVEILPYQLRAKGFTVFNFAISLSLIFNQYANPIALAKLGWKYYIVYCVWLAFELAFMIVFVVETKNRTLEETAALFDGEEKSEELHQRAAVDAGLAGGAKGGRTPSVDEKGSDHMIEQQRA
jgi:sugar porter (SP) family MFS transporter